MTQHTIVAHGRDSHEIKADPVPIAVRACAPTTLHRGTPKRGVRPRGITTWHRRSVRDELPCYWPRSRL